MSTGSQAAVTSPLISNTAAFSPTRRTPVVIAGRLLVGCLPLGEVEHHGVRACRAGRDGPLVGFGEDRGGGPVDLPGQLDDGGSGERPGRGLTCARHVPHLQFAWSARWCAAGRPLLRPSRR